MSAEEASLEALPELLAGGALRLAMDEDQRFRIGFGEPDWLGPIALAVRGREHRLAPGWRMAEGKDFLGRYRRLELSWEGLELPVRANVRAYRDEPLLVFRLEARKKIRKLAMRELGRPSVAWPVFRPWERAEGGVPPEARGYGHQYTEFSFPTFSDDSLSRFRQFPHRPSAFAPLWLIAPDGRCLMLAPLNGFHDQVIAVPREDGDRIRGVQCGWHGDLGRVEKGFATELAVWAGEGPRQVMERWGEALRRRNATRRPSRYADTTLSKLSYWTDNGAVYWYRTEPGLSMTETLGAVCDGFQKDQVPVGAWELDSWFYPHEIPREVSDEVPRIVPPTGMLRWEPREDVIPEGVAALRERLGGAPLILHARHFSSQSPYFEDEKGWVDGDRAHPRDPDFFHRWMAQAASWGAEVVEQDWLVEMWLGVRGLRKRPGRVREWQESVDRAAREHGLHLLWCMATPADFMQTLSLGRVSSIRTSGDYRYLSQNAALWVRFLYTNALARALGLLPFKDVFLSNARGEGLDGDPHAEAEALLAALSAGPVGLGDRLGFTDRELVMRTCRSDGVLVKPDLPIAAIERCFLRDCGFEPEPMVAETWSDHPDGRHAYVVALNGWTGREALDLDLPLSELGDAAPAAACAALEWRSGALDRLEPGDRLQARLEPDDWRFWLLTPLHPLDGRNELAVFGDLSRYASAGDRRVRGITRTEAGLVLDVLGARDEAVDLSGWSTCSPRVELWGPGEEARQLSPQPGLPRPPGPGGEGRRVQGSLAGGAWHVTVPLGNRGWTRVRVGLEADA